MQLPYNIYMFNSDLSEKSDKTEQQCADDDQTINDLFTAQELPIPTPTSDSSKLFYRSSSSYRGSNSNNKFTPDITDDNVKTNLHLGSYIPTKAEKTKPDTGKDIEPEKFGTEVLFKPLVDYYKEKGNKESDFLPKSNKEKSTKNDGLIAKKDATGDFIQLSEDKFPSLQRLFKDNSNY